MQCLGWRLEGVPRGTRVPPSDDAALWAQPAVFICITPMAGPSAVCMCETAAEAQLGLVVCLLGLPQGLDVVTFPCYLN